MAEKIPSYMGRTGTGGATLPLHYGACLRLGEETDRIEDSVRIGLVRVNSRRRAAGGKKERHATRHVRTDLSLQRLEVTPAATQVGRIASSRPGTEPQPQY